MNGENRREQILKLLRSSSSPVPGSSISKIIGVSRQVIVQDIAVLKASGFEILSTHRGYLVQKAPYAERIFKVHHDSAQTEDELSAIVDLGGTVVDVFVRHKLYGQISVKLNLFSQNHVNDFVERLRQGKSSELMSVTDGYHYHTVRAESEQTLNRIAAMLREALEAGADIIMLDNMSVEDMKEAVRLTAGRAETECSGNVTRENVARLVDIGVDYITSGAVTHSAPILDLSLKNLHAVEVVK